MKLIHQVFCPVHFPYKTLVRRFGILAFSLLMVSSQYAYAQKAPKLSPAEFSKLITELSEFGGHFSQDNWVSNEMSYLEVLETIKDNDIKGGVYIGVGPDQNMTYINAIKPDIAFIVDIRHLNRFQHLTYKAIFEMAETRADYLSLLFSIPIKSDAKINKDSDIGIITDYLYEQDPDINMMKETEKKVVDLLKNKYKFELSNMDLNAINYVLDSFYYYGLNITYTGNRRSWYPTYGELITLKEKGEYLNPFNKHEDFTYLRNMHLENRIVPLTGDFGGDKAIRALAKYLKDNKLTVAAYYVSNVEQYVIRDPYKWDNWVENIKSLPINDKTVFIRWTHDNGYWDHRTRLQWMQSFINNATAGKYYDYSDLKYDDYVKKKDDRDR